MRIFSYKMYILGWVGYSVFNCSQRSPKASKFRLTLYEKKKINCYYSAFNVVKYAGTHLQLYRTFSI